MKNQILNGIVVGLFIVIASMIGIKSLFFTRTEGDSLQARVINNEEIIRLQYQDIRDQFDSIRILIIKLSADRNKI